MTILLILSLFFLSIVAGAEEECWRFVNPLENTKITLAKGKAVIGTKFNSLFPTEKKRDLHINIYCKADVNKSAVFSEIDNKTSILFSSDDTVLKELNGTLGKSIPFSSLLKLVDQPKIDSVLKNLNDMFATLEYSEDKRNVTAISKDDDETVEGLYWECSLPIPVVEPSVPIDKTKCYRGTFPNDIYYGGVYPYSNVNHYYANLNATMILESLYGTGNKETNEIMEIIQGLTIVISANVTYTDTKEHTKVTVTDFDDKGGLLFRGISKQLFPILTECSPNMAINDLISLTDVIPILTCVLKKTDDTVNKIKSFFHIEKSEYTLEEVKPLLIKYAEQANLLIYKSTREKFSLDIGDGISVAENLFSETSCSLLPNLAKMQLGSTKAGPIGNLNLLLKPFSVLMGKGQWFYAGLLNELQVRFESYEFPFLLPKPFNENSFSLHLIYDATYVPSQMNTELLFSKVIASKQCKFWANDDAGAKTINDLGVGTVKKYDELNCNIKPDKINLTDFSIYINENVIAAQRISLLTGKIHKTDRTPALAQYNKGSKQGNATLVPVLPVAEFKPDATVQKPPPPDTCATIQISKISLYLLKNEIIVDIYLPTWKSDAAEITIHFYYTYKYVIGENGHHSIKIVTLDETKSQFFTESKTVTETIPGSVIGKYIKFTDLSKVMATDQQTELAKYIDDELDIIDYDYITPTEPKLIIHSKTGTISTVSTIECTGLILSEPSSPLGLDVCYKFNVPVYGTFYVYPKTELVYGGLSVLNLISSIDAIKEYIGFLAGSIASTDLIVSVKTKFTNSAALTKLEVTDIDTSDSGLFFISYNQEASFLPHIRTILGECEITDKGIHEIIGIHDILRIAKCLAHANETMKLSNFLVTILGGYGLNLTAFETFFEWNILKALALPLINEQIGALKLYTNHEDAPTFAIEVAGVKIRAIGEKLDCSTKANLDLFGYGNDYKTALGIYNILVKSDSLPELLGEYLISGEKKHIYVKVDSKKNISFLPSELQDGQFFIVFDLTITTTVENNRTLIQYKSLQLATSNLWAVNEASLTILKQYSPSLKLNESVPLNILVQNMSFDAYEPKLKHDIETFLYSVSLRTSPVPYFYSVRGKFYFESVKKIIFCDAYPEKLVPPPNFFADYVTPTTVPDSGSHYSVFALLSIVLIALLL